jgi:hypothetical protein
VLYRVGETRGGAATYTPRMAFFERRGAMGGASAAGHLYGDASGTDGNQIPPILTWDGAAKVIEQPEEGKSRFVAQLEAYDDDAYDDDDDERLDSDDDDDDDDDDDRGPLDLAEDDADVSVSKPPSDPVEALRARMAGHILRADADDRARRGDGEILGFPDLAKARKRESAPRSAEERRAAREEKARRADEANAKLVEAARFLESESRTWTDFSKASFHSRSAFLLDGVWSGVDAFGGFGEGVAWADARDRREDLRDVARRWAEECDRMQGFQVFAEDLGGFGGLAAATLEELKDEYPRQPAWLFSLRPPLPSSREAREEGRRTDSSAAAAAEAARYFLLNDALATATLAPLCDAYVPLGAEAAAGSRATDALPPGFFGADGRNRFRASALAAAFADVAGTSWRARGSHLRAAGARDLRDVARHLSARAGGPFVSAAFVIDPEPGVSGRPGSAAAGAARASSNDAETDAAAAAAAAAAARAREAAAPTRRFAGLTPGVRGDRRVRVSSENEENEENEEEEDEPTAEAYASRGVYERVQTNPSRSNAVSASFERASAASSLASLDAALRLERYRAPRLRFVSEAPLPLPLTFPEAFAGRPPPRFAAATARLASTPAFARALSRARDGWARAARAAAGRAALRAWGVDDDEVEEVSERVLELRRGYADDDDPEDESDDDELEQM